MFQIEDSIYQFVKSPDTSMEIPAGLNGFRRLLAYRIAQRFGLTHSTSDTMGENGERVIIIYKTAVTIIPKVLLIDMKYTDDGDDGTATLSPSTSGSALSSAVSSTGPSATPVQTEEAPKKVLVMKRSGGSGQNTMKSGSAKQQMSAEEKEKAYLEARARIFGDEAAAAAANANGTAGSSKSNSPAPGSGPDSGCPSPTPAKTASAPAISTPSVSAKVEKKTPSTTPIAASTQSSKGSNAATASPAEPSQGSESESAKFRASNNSGSTKSGRSGKPAVDVTSWKGNKSQVRNVDAERQDPDFARRSAPSANNGYYPNGSVPPAPMLTPPGARGVQTTGYYSQQSGAGYYQSQQMPPQGMPQSGYYDPYYGNNGRGGYPQDYGYGAGYGGGGYPQQPGYGGGYVGGYGPGGYPSPQGGYSGGYGYPQGYGSSNGGRGNNSSSSSSQQQSLSSMDFPPLS